jgi:hypothetical protein
MPGTAIPATEGRSTIKRSTHRPERAPRPHSLR